MIALILYILVQRFLRHKIMERISSRALKCFTNCLTNHTISWDNSKIITTNRRYHQRLCLEAWHINSAHAPLNRDDGGLLPDAYLHLVRKKAAN